MLLLQVLILVNFEDSKFSVYINFGPVRRHKAVKQVVRINNHS